MWKSTFWKAVHWVIIINFFLEIIYASYMVFFALTPPGASFVLFGSAEKIPFEIMMKRRLYAIEAWIAITGLSIYLALTEIMPSKKQ